MFDTRFDSGRCVAADLITRLGWEAKERRLLLVKLGVEALSVSVS
jgi:hypothetical protein